MVWGIVRRKMFGILILITLVLPWRAALGGHPFGTEDSATLGRGSAELELNFEITADGGNREYSIENIITVGLLDLLDVSIEYEYLFLDARDEESVDGFGDTGIFLKYAILDPAESSFGLVLKLGAVLPTGDEKTGTGSGAKDYEVELIIQRELEEYDVTLNLAYVFTGNRPEGAAADELFRASLAIEKEVIEEIGLSIVSEAEYETAESGEETDSFTILGGFELAVSERTAVNLGVKTGLTGAGPDIAVISGLTVSF